MRTARPAPPRPRRSDGCDRSGATGEREQRLLHCVDVAAAVDKAPAGASGTLAQRRADALCDLVEAGFAYLAQGGVADPEVATVSVVWDYDVLCERAPGTAAT